MPTPESMWEADVVGCNRTGALSEDDKRGSAAPVKVHYHIDLPQLREVGNVCIRRAAAFLGYGYFTTLGDPLTSLTLPGLWQIRLLDDPLTPEAAREAQLNYRTWIIGGCLAELDQGFQRFQSGLWRCIELAKVAGGVVKAGWAPAELRATNSGSRQEQILAALGVSDPTSLTYKAQLRSLTLARNCLMHDSGFLNSERVDGADHLLMSWSYFATFLDTPDGPVPVGRDQPQIQPYEVDVGVYARIAERQRRLDVGTHIELDPHDQIEICLFYQLLVERSLFDLETYLARLGIAADSPVRDDVPQVGLITT